MSSHIYWIVESAICEDDMRLIRKTESICPEDLRVIEAGLWEIDGQVIMRKTCPDHGDFEDVYWSDYQEYIRAEGFRDDGGGLPNGKASELGCPHDCGLCQRHRTHTTLLIIELTNRCNLRCPVCFARGGEDGRLYEPSLRQIRDILEYAQENNHPLKVRAVANSGGEPTLREDLFEIIEMEKELGFDYIPIMTNGLVIAEDIDYFKRLRDLGVWIYLQFDGITPEPYMKTRGQDLWPVKQRVIENAREIGFDRVVISPVLAKGINDHQVGDIVRYAARNSDIIKHVVFQPVSFVGRINRSRLKEMRITTPDVMRLCEEQTGGEIKRGDFFSLSMNQTLARMVTKGGRNQDFCVHPHCGVATILECRKDRMVPLPRFIDNEVFYAKMRRAFELKRSTPRISLR